MNKKNKTLASNMVFFGLVIIVSKGFGYLLLPIFTNYMSTRDYGIADLLLSTVNLLYPLSALGMSSAILRYTISEVNDRKYIFTTAYKIITLTIVVTIPIWPIVMRLTNFSYYIWFIPVEIYFTNLIAIISSLCKGIGKTKLILVQTMLKGVVLVCAAVASLKWFDMGISGFVFSYLLADVVSVICLALTVRLREYVEIRLPNGIWKAYSKKMLKYGAPLVPNSMSAWVVQMSDRYMVTYWCGAEANGLYAVAYKIPSIIKVFTSIFISAWQLNVISEAGKEGADKYFNKMRGLYSAVCLLGAAVLMVFLKLIARILFAKEFFDAWRYVPLLLLAAVMDLISEYLGSYFFAGDRTGQLFFSTLLGAVVNIALNVIMIPRFAAWGATIATVISFAVMFFYRGRTIKRTMGYKTFSLRESFGVGIILLLCIVFYYFDDFAVLCSILSLTIISILYRKEIVMICDKLKHCVAIRQEVDNYESDTKM